MQREVPPRVPRREGSPRLIVHPLRTRPNAFCSQESLSYQRDAMPLPCEAYGAELFKL